MSVASTQSDYTDTRNESSASGTTNSGDRATAYGILLYGHGSRDQDGVTEFEQLVKVLRHRADGIPIYYSFLEFARPTIDEAVDLAIKDGVNRLVVVPALLAAATHAKNDMPAELLALRERYPNTEFHFGASMDLHPLLLQLSRERILEAEVHAEGETRRSETCLVVVGRGTSDPDANSEISKLTRMLEEGMGFGTSFVCYAGTAKPIVADGLRAAAKFGHKRIIVFPYFLFDGILIKRIYAACDSLQKRFPEIEVLKAQYLGIHPSIADVFLDRAREGFEGRAHMNCSLCKYRVQIVGFESQVGTPQQAHHLRVKGSSGTESNPLSGKKSFAPYEPHPIEAESFKIIESLRDWSNLPEVERRIAQRLVHTSGTPEIVEDLFFSSGAAETGVRALLRCKLVITDVTMVESGIKSSLRDMLGIRTWCGVHDPESKLMAEKLQITRSAAGINRAFEIFDNDAILAIGDAPTAVMEALRLVRDQGWRPQLIIGLPVGFVGTQECKQELRRCLQIPRITNSGTKGGSPWAAAVINALMIEAVNQLAASSENSEISSPYNKQLSSTETATGGI